MIRISEARLKGFVPGFTSSTSQVIKSVDAEMWATETQLLIRSLKTKKDLIIPSSEAVYMLPAEPLEGIFDSPAPEPKAPGPKPKVVQVVVPPPERAPLEAEVREAILNEPHPTPTSNIVNSIADDTIRLVKIGDKVVERKGPPQDDELEALTAPRKTVAQMIAEADGEEE